MERFIRALKENFSKSERFLAEWCLPIAGFSHFTAGVIKDVDEKALGGFPEYPSRFDLLPWNLYASELERSKEAS
jgi:hypothetical protein